MQNQVNQDNLTTVYLSSVSIATLVYSLLSFNFSLTLYTLTLHVSPPNRSKLLVLVSPLRSFSSAPRARCSVSQRFAVGLNGSARAPSAYNCSSEFLKDKSYKRWCKLSVHLREWCYKTDCAPKCNEMAYAVRKTFWSVLDHTFSFLDTGSTQ
jgi:hypothetical protein